jgi:hypothetical protein
MFEMKHSIVVLLIVVVGIIPFWKIYSREFSGLDCNWHGGAAAQHHLAVLCGVCGMAERSSGRLVGSMTVGIINMWREARGAVLRGDYKDDRL